ncbi:unnamed protein product [Prorocentrum cordatum]|uniref:Uncharacterized protein n=1 Tax=Prorocentrum cordatum TaxID=2364126 RepID=A0ABN9VWT7_9DINO|nr:unnamed protein product [Polarella glacialis]
MHRRAVAQQKELGAFLDEPASVRLLSALRLRVDRGGPGGADAAAEELMREYDARWRRLAEGKACELRMHERQDGGPRADAGPVMNDSGRRAKDGMLEWERGNVAEAHASWYQADDALRRFKALGGGVVPQGPGVRGHRQARGRRAGPAVAHPILVATAPHRAGAAAHLQARVRPGRFPARLRGLPWRHGRRAPVARGPRPARRRAEGAGAGQDPGGGGAARAAAQHWEEQLAPLAAGGRAEQAGPRAAAAAAGREAVAAVGCGTGSSHGRAAAPVGRAEGGRPERPPRGNATALEEPSFNNTVLEGFLGLTAVVLGGCTTMLFWQMRGGSKLANSHFGPKQQERQATVDMREPGLPPPPLESRPARPRSAEPGRGPAASDADLAGARPARGPCRLPLRPQQAVGGAARAGSGGRLLLPSVASRTAAASRRGRCTGAAGEQAPPRRSTEGRPRRVRSPGPRRPPAVGPRGRGRGGAGAAAVGRDEVAPEADPRVLCEESVVPDGWEIIFELPDVLTAQRQEMTFHIFSAQGETISEVVVDEHRPAGECGMRVAQMDGRLMGTVHTDAVHRRRGGMPHICRPCGAVFGTLSREDSAGASRYALRGEDCRLLFVFKGDFQCRRVSVLRADDGQKVCVVEPAPSSDLREPRYQAKVCEGTDASVVLCGLLAIDKVHGGRESE